MDINEIFENLINQLNKKYPNKLKNNDNKLKTLRDLKVDISLLKKYKIKFSTNKTIYTREGFLYWLGGEGLTFIPYLGFKTHFEFQEVKVKGLLWGANIEYGFKKKTYGDKKDFEIVGKSRNILGHTFPIDEKNILEDVLEYVDDYLEEQKNKDESKKRLLESQRKEEEDNRREKLKKSQSNILSELDKDGNGEVDVIEGNDLSLLLKKHQKSIIEIDRSYVQQFIKISSYLKIKKNNIQLIFKSIKDTPNEQTLNQYVEVLKGDVHSYNLVLFNSLNMIVSLVEDDTITFYEIHEMFDNLNIFDSKHERDVSQKLNNIGDGLKDLMYSIEEMGSNIESQMGELTYVTEQSNQQLENQLESIGSSIKTNNLLTGINSYQTYKLRKGE